MKLSEMYNNRFQNQSKSDEFGFTSKYDDKNKRVINKNGTFNVKRIGEKQLLFHKLISMSWLRFIFSIIIFYVSINLLFAAIYYLVDKNGIGFYEDYEISNRFSIAIFFSAQTLTTVGYGSLYPISISVSIISTVEALIGLLSFAIFTGLMYGRFSKPVHGVKFSKNALIAPYKDAWSFQFRIVNEMSNNLLELEAKALLSIVVIKENKPMRQFMPLDLDNGKVSYLPLNWTLVHPINEKSPLANMTQADFEAGNVEILVMVKAFNDTFAQEIHARSSYRFPEILWYKKFKIPYHFSNEGSAIFEIEKIDEIESVAELKLN